MPDPLPIACPRCGGQNLTVCGRSTQLVPEEYANQPLAEREQVTVAYQCVCGLAFTKTIGRDGNSKG